MTQRYDTYKDSGVQWLGEIPGHWEMSKISSHFRQRNEKVSDKDYPALSVSKQGVTPQLDNVALSNAEGTSRKLVKVGDYAVNSRSDRKGSCGVSKYEGSVSLITIVLEPFNINGEYVHYLFRSNPWVEEFYRNGRGIVADLWTTNYQMMKSMYMPVPPLSEQRSIVSFLDAKCGKIDEWVTKKQKEVEHLQELKQRVIADAVTQGLNPHVKMKTTNIPWLKEIPEYWEIKPIRAILRENTDKTETGDEELLSLSQYTGISRKKDAAKIGMFEAESTVGYKKVHPGQFVMNIMLAWNGSYAVSEFEGIISPAYCVFDFISKDEKMYYNYLWRLSMYQGAFKTESRGIIDSRLRLYPSKFLPFPTICPPIEEQKQIVSYLDAKTSKIDKLIANITKEIECIKEYKQRLISDVVTGQIKVC